ALVALIAFGGYTAYDFYRAGYHTRPTMPDGAFSFSFTNGLRGILVGVTKDEESRRYLGFPFEVPFYLEDAWSWCHPPTDSDNARAANIMSERDWPGQRLEAVCRIKIEDEEIVRGLIISV